jgi:hypothetical protein
MIEDYIFWISLIEMLFGRQLCSPLCHQWWKCSLKWQNWEKFSGY